MQPKEAADTVVLIHGLWMTPLAWEHWVNRYAQRGLRVITPGYPGVEPGMAGVEALRRDPSLLANLGVREVFDHLAEIISSLQTAPISAMDGTSAGGAANSTISALECACWSGIHGATLLRMPDTTSSQTLRNLSFD